MKQNPLKQVHYRSRKFDDYLRLTPEVVNKAKQIARSLQGLRITHLNATALGGGVAEMLRCIVPLEKDLGLKSKWLVIPPDESFFEITKKIHNLMQGQPGNLTKKEREIYLSYNQKIAKWLLKKPTDILIIHDPQPATVLKYLGKRKPPVSIWRCHIDTACPNRKMWHFLRPYLEPYDHYVFTTNKCANGDFPKNKLSFITPVIDVYSLKNIKSSVGEARFYLKRFGIDIKRPLLTQISRLDPWKDPVGVIDAYRLAKEKIPELQLALVAQMSIDDPEAKIVQKKIERYVGNDPDIFLLINLPKNDVAVNAFQTASNIILQKSIREGFGLTVTEAMWKGAVVIGW